MNGFNSRLRRDIAELRAKTADLDAVPATRIDSGKAPDPSARAKFVLGQQVEVIPTDLVSISQACHLFALDKGTVGRWIATGRVTAYGAGVRATRVSIAQLMRPRPIINKTNG